VVRPRGADDGPPYSGPAADKPARKRSSISFGEAQAFGSNYIQKNQASKSTMVSQNEEPEGAGVQMMDEDENDFDFNHDQHGNSFHDAIEIQNRA